MNNPTQAWKDRTREKLRTEQTVALSRVREIFRRYVREVSVPEVRQQVDGRDCGK
jgi:hypothetical protein